MGLAGSLERTNVRLETIPHHGYVNFYTSISKKWYEFNAKFTDGKLVEIKEESAGSGMPMGGGMPGMM